jgi:hypothetical protein
MKRFAWSLAAGLLASPIAACPGASPTIDGGTPEQGASVCAHLAAVGCPQPAICATVFAERQGRLTDFKPACLLAATTVSAVEACGSVTCPL